MLGKILILKRKLAMSPLYTEKTCIERVTPQLTSFFFFFCIVGLLKNSLYWSIADYTPIIFIHYVTTML